MRILLLIPIAISGLASFVSAQGKDSGHWDLDQLNGVITAHGPAKQSEGVSKKSMVLDGRTVVELNHSAAFNAETSDFTVSIWFNPYELAGDQQMLIGKNRYSLNERQWGILIEPDGRVRAYLHQSGWKTITSDAPLKPGHWHQAVLSVGKGQAALFLNGKVLGEIDLPKPIPNTRAPITIGGIRDGNRNRQEFRGALDEVSFEPRVIPAKEIAANYKPVSATHEIPEPPEPPKRFTLWDENSELKRGDALPELKNVEFHIIKKWDKPADGYTFLHGVGLAWHKGKLYASIGHNKGAENTVTEEAQYRVSEDGGKTWGLLQVIDAGGEGNLAVSHGVFLSHEDKLWAFQGAYFDRMKKIHTRAYSLDENSGQWTHHGAVIGDGFWAMNQPVKMDDGNWIMPGGSFGPYSGNRVFPAAVAISHGDDFTKWDMVSIPVNEEVHRMWGESSLFVDGATIYNLARYGGDAQALIAVSKDHGRTWSSSEISNLPMATSKPAAGVLSNGQRYLVCTTAARNGGKRTPLTIAVSRPGENVFSKVYVIRRSQNAQHPGESNDQLSLSYPYAIEHEGKLYVGYSNNGGRKGNLNSAELAVIPISELETGDE